eukprot:CAMPEP_0114260350 /NCGR_PEP_ID=MMETSP0058-20121206/20437_1 /TAXON_ID=36894 /ORGANISM="Pyramimonas parkeae, CCMP726" /LENGTH=141 /DNA_ID=CAMNT_0001375573 /DNA_START=245 /DNA_END=666 /DNA_ORIENTATION=-
MGSDMPCKKDDFETEHDVAPPKCGLSMTSYSPVKFKISLVGPYGSGDCHSCESQNALVLKVKATEVLTKEPFRNMILPRQARDARAMSIQARNQQDARMGRGTRLETQPRQVQDPNIHICTQQCALGFMLRHSQPAQVGTR